MSTAVYRHTVDGLTFRTESTEAGTDWYRWKVELDEPPATLGRIADIEYILHKTFTNRIRRVSDASTHFALESEGWGDFDILVNVYFRDGDEKTLKVPLKLT